LQDGYIHVTLREVEPASGEFDRGNKITLELAVLDTGKGISQDFLKNQLFHPFSQENPLQTGTGLGLAIVSSIVRSGSVDGNIDVSSAEGVGTDIRITFTAEKIANEDMNESNGAIPRYSNMEPFALTEFRRPPAVALYGFESYRRGDALMKDVLSMYLLTWGLEVGAQADAQLLGLDSGAAIKADVAIVNEDVRPIVRATHGRDPRRPFVILSGQRGDTGLTSVVAEYESIGGFARIVYKPGGPSRIRSALKLCLHALTMSQRPRTLSNIDGVITGMQQSPEHNPHDPLDPLDPLNKSLSELSLKDTLSRRHSEDRVKALLNKRPPLGPRALTMEATIPQWQHDNDPTRSADEDGPAKGVNGEVEGEGVVWGDGGEDTDTPGGSVARRLSEPSQTHAPSPPIAAPAPIPAPALMHVHMRAPTITNRASSMASDTSLDEQGADADDDDVATIVPISGGGSVLKTSMMDEPREGTTRVLVIEDNHILRNLLVKWLRSKVSVGWS
jgi:hypothetical protein